MANNGDAMVRATQIWLNRTYGTDTRFDIIPETVYGKTGWTTIYALTKALQIELGIQATANNFGPSTQSRFNSTFPTGVHPQENVCNNIFGIIQGALWCKGYNTGHYAVLQDGEYVIEAIYDSSVANAVSQLQLDAGRSSSTGVVDLNIMKALLSMDSFVTNRNITQRAKIQDIQRYLNSKYENYIGLMPCDGYYGRATNKALIYAIQAEEKMSVSVANGNFGPSTKSCCPTIPYNNIENKYGGGEYSENDINNFIKILQAGLYCNGYGNGELTGIYDINTLLALNEFQEDYALEINPSCTLTTWLSIFTSCGDTSRSCIASDTRFEMTSDRIQYLKQNGIQYVGRYITGTDFKILREGELQRIINNDIGFFPIFQESMSDLSYFSESRGIQDAISATNAAKDFRIPRNSIIYFAVDFDPQSSEIENYIIPYFRSLSNYMTRELGAYYKVGVYGTRNVCQQVLQNNYAVTCFVSDMSTGYSGNMGFKIPKKWNLDQFSEIKNISTNSGVWDLDKVAYSGKFPMVTNLSSEIDSTNENFENLFQNLETLYNYATEYSDLNNKNLSINERNMLVLQYLRHDKYNGTLWTNVAGEIDNDFITFVENKNNSSLNISNIFIPKQGYDNMDIQHLSATLNSLLYNSIVYETDGNDLSGWAGDLLQLGCTICNRLGDKSITNEDVYYLIGGLDDLLANRLFGTDDMDYNANKVGFGFEDYELDIDAVNIAYNISNNNYKIHEAFRNYYINSYNSRFIVFVNSFIDNYNSSNLESKIYNYVKKYTDLNSAAALAFVLNFSDEYGSYDKDKVSEILATQFAKKIADEVYN